MVCGFCNNEVVWTCFLLWIKNFFAIHVSINCYTTVTFWWSHNLSKCCVIPRYFLKPLLWETLTKGGTHTMDKKICDFIFFHAIVSSLPMYLQSPCLDSTSLLLKRSRSLMGYTNGPLHSLRLIRQQNYPHLAQFPTVDSDPRSLHQANIITNNCFIYNNFGHAAKRMVFENY